MYTIRTYTKSLDVAAAVLTVKGKLDNIDGRYPDNSFSVSCNYWKYLYLRYIGFLPYLKFCDKRKYLKEQCKIKNNIPLHYTEKIRGYKLEDIATVRSFSASERGLTPIS